ncbi:MULTISPECIES: M17 family metallopeptidase [unclassified Kaistella]|uniref:leucyl aminopeptidase family protein n=1 Tax=unclassified Kaistella TaxID=2762626 RepID=UPI0027353ABF|nr:MULTISPECIES: leucyl aminopeptidase [unclassified Kaistella]MDP2455153.1 leucyl aminopeptidase [Kaistella sp. SH11-4b]MDP2458127.1 leucyl aminopeptidase [Kaistella sp. SH40-3]MDP2460920.1 leucyl aminopeptidase [Kaistella sp. SH19-2b]
MIDNYLNAELILNSQNDNKNGNELELLINSADEVSNQYPKSVVESIKEAFEKKKNKVIITNGDIQKFLIALPKTDLESLRLAGASVFQALKNENCKEVNINGVQDLDENQRIAFLEGLLLSSYSFSRYKKEKSGVQIKVSCTSNFIDEKSLTELKKLAEAVSLTKTMVNEPPQFMDALKFAEYAVDAGKKFGFETQILGKAQIEELRMGGILAVNRGSSIPPTFNIFNYKPENAVNEKPLVLVGKGVTFDTGGYSIKVGGNMTSMKSDMAGGAAVLGIVSAAAANKLPYHIIGLVSATDNKISSDALVVDDIITMMDGTTVEVQNTDAEGRLVLADALTYAERFNPELVVDMATLTGASVAITGSFGIAMAGNDQSAMDLLKVSGEETYERLIQLPFWTEFEDLLKSDIADLKNIGGPIGGATTAGKFLEHFTDYPWIHLDIAGASFVNDAKGYRQSGGTGVAVRLLYQFIKTKCK